MTKKEAVNKVMFSPDTSIITTGDKGGVGKTLVEIDHEMSDHKGPPQSRLILLKHALISIGNLVNLERTMRQLYKTHPELSAYYKPLEKHFSFAKYLRNIFVGHTNDTLVAKAIDWKPEILFLLAKDGEVETHHLNLCLLETAINTYVDEAGRHRIFFGDTDLNYPPDLERFLIYLTETVRGGIRFLDLLITATRTHTAPPPDDKGQALALFLRAGLTNFKMIIKAGS